MFHVRYEQIAESDTGIDAILLILNPWTGESSKPALHLIHVDVSGTCFLICEVLDLGEHLW